MHKIKDEYLKGLISFLQSPKGVVNDFSLFFEFNKEILILQNGSWIFKNPHGIMFFNNFEGFWYQLEENVIRDFAVEHQERLIMGYEDKKSWGFRGHVHFVCGKKIRSFHTILYTYQCHVWFRKH